MERLYVYRCPKCTFEVALEAGVTVKLCECLVAKAEPLCHCGERPTTHLDIEYEVNGTWERGSMPRLVCDSCLEQFQKPGALFGAVSSWRMVARRFE